MTPSRDFDIKHEAGSSLFIILIAIAAFAALTFALSQSDGAKSLSDEKIRVLATDVMDAGNHYADIAARLRLAGYSENQISFINPVVGGYGNANCTSDACRFFYPTGGNAQFEQGVVETNGGKIWGFVGNAAIPQVGTSAADLIAVLPQISLQICQRINALLGVYTISDSPPFIAAGAFPKFTGTYNAAPAVLNFANLNGKTSGCIQIGTATGNSLQNVPLTNKYFFYQVLVAR